VFISELTRYQSRSARTGSIRVARQAGRKQAANETIVITRNADPEAHGSRGLTKEIFGKGAR
jgi:hypothetical protein